MSPATSTAPIDAERIASDVRTIRRPTPTTIAEATEELEKLRKLFDSSALPSALSPPFEAKETEEFARALLFLREQRDVDLEWLRGFSGEDVPGTDRFSAQPIDNAKRSAISRLETYLPGELDHILLDYVEDLVDTEDKDVRRESLIKLLTKVCQVENGPITAKVRRTGKKVRVTREEFEVVRDMARAAREENEALKVRIAALEERLGKTS